MSKVTACKCMLLVALVFSFVGAAAMRHHLNSAHKLDLAKQDRACLNSVFQVTQSVKKLKKQKMF